MFSVVLIYNLSVQAISYIIVSFAMYVASQITPLEWRKAPVCNHDDDDDDDDNEAAAAAGTSNKHELHLCKNSSNSFSGHDEEHFTSADGDGNCSENYSTLDRYFKNASEMSEGSEDAWMNIEHRRNFLERQHNHHGDAFVAPRNFDETLDIDDDGLIGFEDARHSSSHSTYANEEHEEHNNNIELIAYVNNFNLRTCFWWAMGTLIQTTSDLQPKVSLASRVNLITEM